MIIKIINYFLLGSLTVIYIIININILFSFIDLDININFFIVQFIIYIYYLLIELNILYYNIFFKLQIQIKELIQINTTTTININIKINNILQKKFYFLILYFTICIAISYFHTVLLYLNNYKMYFLVSIGFLLFKITIVLFGIIYFKTIKKKNNKNIKNNDDTEIIILNHKLNYGAVHINKF